MNDGPRIGTKPPFLRPLPVTLKVDMSPVDEANRIARNKGIIDAAKLVRQEAGRARARLRKKWDGELARTARRLMSLALKIERMP